ncbi:hypothetical protein KC343_g5854 [Hortaea werneckii]|nr:hypothetical protein KC352_g12709 [Hortaea werneckii]KAI7565880.1 hypothetical protein KC317_g6055 [Hortaea werneckii]KAI7617068.1 hypothetical protein KC346_g5674 [Hortaea werneckii]KAI7627913.1 hypothetical protein KC343_g5854 [Hortaea werneckii]KAI7670265.1 hypothetical protein KC319_g5930 [Hortaea werneckii]
MAPYRSPYSIVDQAAGDARLEEEVGRLGREVNRLGREVGRLEKTLREERSFIAGEIRSFKSIMDSSRRDGDDEMTDHPPTRPRSRATSRRGGSQRRLGGQARSGQAQSGAAPSVEAASTQPERQARGPDARTIVIEALQQRLGRQEQHVDAPCSGEAAPTLPQRQAGGADARTIALAALQERLKRKRMVNAPPPEAPAWQGQGMQPQRQPGDRNADLDTWDQPAFHDPEARNAQDLVIEALDQGTAPGFGAMAIFEHEMKKRL